MLHRKKALLRAAAPVAVLALALTACGSDGDSSGDEKQDDKAKASQEADAGGEEEEQGDEEEAPDNGGLTLGDTAEGQHEYDMSDGKAQLEITAEKVDKGETADLVAAGLKEEDVKGTYPVFVYFKYTVKEAKDLDDPGFNRKTGVMAEGDEAAKRLAAIGADPIKGGCPEEEDELKWEVGASNTLCSTFLVPDGKEVEKVAWVGDYSNPLMWSVK